MIAVIAPPILFPREIRKLNFSEPRRNLPGRKGVATAEDRFTISFSRDYALIYNKIHSSGNLSQLAVAREIPVNGYGIADLMAVSWNLAEQRFEDIEDFLRSGKPRTRAFECKLDNWRKAMSQAHRYRYFAHQAIVVLPENICHRALPYIETFRKIRVGLWGYDPKMHRITAYHTPRPMKPKSGRYYIHSVRQFNQATGQSLPIP